MRQADRQADINTLKNYTPPSLSDIEAQRAVLQRRLTYHTSVTRRRILQTLSAAAIALAFLTIAIDQFGILTVVLATIAALCFCPDFYPNAFSAYEARSGLHRLAFFDEHASRDMLTLARYDTRVARILNSWPRPPSTEYELQIILLAVEDLDACCRAFNAAQKAASSS